MTFVLLTRQFEQTTVMRRGRVMVTLPSVYRLILVPTSLLYPYSTGQVEPDVPAVGATVVRR